MPTKPQRTPVAKESRRLPPTRNAPDPAHLAVTLTVEQLQGLIRHEVEAVLLDGAGDPEPLLLDRQQLAQRLGCSSRHLDKLRQQGLPTIWLLDAPRFRLDAVLAWLADRGAPASRACTDGQRGSVTQLDSRRKG